ncbi:hypothetical protein ACFFK0_16005 [Paenibacillus chartarius]|uniref:Glycosyltransferase RgtA/B/C/D-like domain-containing protein n=1 Tax=Paenibacillus chartarius TaxID=747481 RepID=A0ABV6DMR7_9BACL
MQNRNFRLAAKWCIAVSGCLFGLVAALYAAMFVVLLLRLPVTRMTLSLGLLVMAAAVAAFAIWRLRRGAPGGSLWLRGGSALLISAICAAVSVYSAGVIYDTSYDGQVYHYFAVLQLQSGWNPIYDPMGIDLIWVNHYPKGVWFIAAAIYTLTGFAETGKAVNVIVMASSFFAALAVLLAVFSAERKGEAFSGLSALSRGSAAVLIAASAAMNPVTSMQLFTYYNDGIIGSLLLLLAAALAYFTYTYERRALWLSAGAVVLLINVKFTAIAYAGILCATMVAAVAIRLWLENKDGSMQGGEGGVKARLLAVLKARAMWRPITVLLATAAVAVVVIGWNPYVFNTVKQGHPFYPLAGKGALDIMTVNSPADFHNHTRWYKFAVSYTSKTEDVIAPNVTHRSAWWPIDWRQFANLNVDTRIAGFGPLSRWLLVLTPALGLLIVMLRWRVGVVAAFAGAGLLASVFINPEPWWARYVPQLWLVPLVFVAAAWRARQWLLRGAGAAVLAMCFISAYLCADISIGRAYKQSQEVKAQLQDMQGKQVALFSEAFKAPAQRMKEWGIDYREVKKEDLRCKQPVTAAYAASLLCIE